MNICMYVRMVSVSEITSARMYVVQNNNMMYVCTVCMYVCTMYVVE
jgi:hypothetical protein